MNQENALKSKHQQVGLMRFAASEPKDEKVHK